MVHMGQHYNEVISERFYTDLGIPVPAYNMQVGSASLGVQCVRILMGTEESFRRCFTGRGYAVTLKCFSGDIGMPLYRESLTAERIVEAMETWFMKN